MTRVAADIPPCETSDQLLLTVLGEEPRILTSVLNRIESKKDFNDIPSSFRMGTGHIKFFFNKCEFIYNRYLAFRQEYKRRENKDYSLLHLKAVTEKYNKIKSIRPDLCNDWKASKSDNEIAKKRILERSKGYSKAHTYYGSIIDNWEVFLGL